MSVDIVNGVSPELVPYMTTFWGIRQDTIIHIEGLEGPPHGIPLPDFPGDDQWARQQPFCTNVKRWRADPDGSNDDTKFVTGIKALIEEYFDPRGRLVITGKSTGGVNALQLCRHLAARCGFFRLNKLTSAITDDEPKGQFYSTNDNTPFTFKVRIDLVCIFDASFDTNAFTRQRLIPPMVRTFANWFQTQDKDTQVHTTLVPIDSSITRRVMERNCNNDIPFSERKQAHVFVCKNLGPREATPMIENDLRLPTFEIRPTVRGRR
jgi:hypothetical protein